MPFSVIKAQAKQYTLIAAVLLLSWFLSSTFIESIDAKIMGLPQHSHMLIVLLSIVMVFSLGFVVYELAKPTILPSFVLAVVFGLVCRPVLSHLIESPTSLTTLITIGAVLILFGGGLETPFTKFRRLIGPILSLAFLGTFLNAFLLALLLVTLANWLGVALPLSTAVLLGAAIASTDPAAIIPCFQELHFRKPRVKYIAVSESAINDVVGAVLVTIFLTILLRETPTTVAQAYGLLLDPLHILIVIRTIAIGTVVGALGFGILHSWSRWKERIQTEDGTDAALFLAVPLFAFTVAEIIGGNGFLAVFLTGLLFHMRSHFRHVQHYFNHTIEGFMKPMIFMLLGAMVDPADLLGVAGLGLLVSFLFIFVLRPLIIFISLTPFHISKQKLSWPELLFLCCVRETGVIPAALLITISLAGVTGSETAMAIGLWVILSTLIILPPLTPLIGKWLGIAADKPTPPERQHHGPVAVLCSRGYSFPERMKTVVEWAHQHSVDNIALLHCPEDKYSPEFVHDVQQRAEELFIATNHQLESEGKPEINFEFLCGPGLLQDNIESLIADGDVSIIFVGTRMLDYRLEDVKRLPVPFYFMP